MQDLAPRDEARLDLACPIAKILARPDGVFFQIPAQLLRLDRPQRGDKTPALVAVDFPLPRRGGLIHEPGASRGPAHAVLLLELQVGQLEHQVLQGLGLRLRSRRNVRREPLAQGHEDCVERRLDSASVAAHGNVDRFLAEELLQHAEPGAVQRQRNDRKLVAAPKLLYVDRVTQLLADPFGLQRIRADHDGVGRRFFDGLLNFLPQPIATAQLAGIDPHVLAKIGERPLEIAHEAVVPRAVGDEQLAHRCRLDSIGRLRDGKRRMSLGAGRSRYVQSIRPQGRGEAPGGKAEGQFVRAQLLKSRGDIRPSTRHRP